ncbi:ribonuclease Z [Aquibacillus sp. 3ASR75-11]|uniref:Ribonuclease Z n=1 Tax=Terrihalobacillus insolitus TaxID=2950438 RepID=A0A9X4AN05_9BACI|nr:ribonuclease Z [Terrihalobacillus insolitus]MDC3414469.1 ribonuclease Z [Terrihalobacillus insolitus]MDC3425349.1 ribonuclease Z [Terrihalobacillus insolitus]
MELFFLGTGSGLPSKRRNVTSIALQMLQERGSIWIFDCGEATQHQILKTSIRPRRIEKIFITHLHGDHIYGLPGLLSSRSFQGGETALKLYGPRGLKNFVETSLSVSDTHLPYQLEIIEVEPGVIFEDFQFTVTCQLLDHGIQSYGYQIIEKDLPGELLVDKLKQNGIEPGPIYQQIKQQKTITLENGKIIHGEDYTGPAKPGRVTTILGDTRYKPDLCSFVEGSDVLVHEATFCKEDEALAYPYHHSTAEQAATLAQQSKVKHLILTHFSSRYQEEGEGKLLNEAQTIFQNTTLARDFLQVDIPRKG